MNSVHGSPFGITAANRTTHSSTVLDFLSKVARIQNLVNPWGIYPRLVVQLKPFFGDCDFSTSWFSQALGPFHSLLAVSSVKLFNERYSKRHERSEYPLQYDPSRSGEVFSVFCGQDGNRLDIWFIDQDDEPGNEDSLFFWKNFDKTGR
ncbi:hypothetical protein BT69DRAFT_1361490 [Atractiella rhizophila]|nr:hypothetical protein BT69DRAFT_1361490 [Atractiella rhizophila]